jgi:hypothetical protein
MFLLAWRLWAQLRHRVGSSTMGLAWEPRGDAAVWDVYDKWREAELSRISICCSLFR